MFPFLSIHYKEIIYGAYKSGDPNVFIKELLDSYEIRQSHIGFLIKTIWNRDIFKNTPLLKTIKEEETKENTPHGIPIARFTYYAVSMCHIWYIKNGFDYYLDPNIPGSITCFEPDCGSMPYIWLDLEEIKLVRCNSKKMDHFRVQLVWEESKRETFLFEISTGDKYIARTNGNYMILHIEKHPANGFMSVECETGIPTAEPYTLIITQEYNLRSVLFNRGDGRVEPLLTSLHNID